MLKSLVVFGVLVAPVGIAFSGQTAPLGTPKQGVAKQGRGSGAGVPAQSHDDKNAADKVTVIFNQNGTPAPQPDKSKDDEDIRIQRKIANFTAWLVFVGAIQAGALIATLIWIRQQARLMREHAGHLNNLAIAARANAQAAIAAQRPWILVDVEVSKDNPDIFLVYGINKGQTPGEIFAGHCSCKPRDPVNFVPPDDLGDPFFFPRQALTVNGERFPIREIGRKWIEDTLAKSPYQMMFVYGKISYWDMFTDRTNPENEHLTRWCFAYLAERKDFVPTGNNYAKND